MLTKVAVKPRADSTIRWTTVYLRAYRGPLAGLASLSLAEIALRALIPWPLKAIVDHLVGGHAAALPLLAGFAGSQYRVALLLAIAATGVVLQLAHEIVLMAHTRVQAGLAQQMVFDLRSRLFTHLQYLSIGQYSKFPVAEAVYRLDADAGCLEHLLLRGVFPSVFSGLTLLVMFGILVRLDGPLAILSIVVVPFLYLGLRLYMRRMQPQAEEAKSLESRVVARAYESLSTIRLVKTFSREDHEVGRYHGAAADANRARLNVTRQESFFSFLVGGITLTGGSLVLALGGVHVLQGRLTVGTLLLIIAYLGYVYGPLSAIATTVGSLHGALASARRVREILALAREPADAADCLEPGRLRGEVEFEDVTFSYGPGRPVLDHVSFKASPGEVVALVGVSGAGKSTLVTLIGRLYEPVSGRVLIDGIDARRYRLKSLREQIAVVLQDATLLSGSVAENIQYGRLDASAEEIAAAACAAGVDEFAAALARGFNTPVGEHGTQLSGGQRQRVNIARAFLKDAPILILDEPTASLDTIAERGVLEALARLRKARTTFVIAHRLSTVRDADRILVLDQGRVAAQGTHDELLLASELYRCLCQQLDQRPASYPAEIRSAG